MLTKEQVLVALRNAVHVPRTGSIRGRDIYETMHGDYQITYPSFPGGTTDTVPRSVIDELEREGTIERSFPKNPKINSWRLRP